MASDQGASSPDGRPRHDWWGLRSLLSWAWVATVGFAAWWAAAGVILAGGLWWDRRRLRLAAIAAWWGRNLAPLGCRPELRGLEHLAGGPFVVVANHQSVVDLLMLYHLPLDYRTVVKRSWFFTPFGLNIWAAGYLPTGSGVLGRGGSWLREGVSVLTFPEGTRSRTWEVGRFKRGAFELAVRAGVPVLPVALAGTNDVCHPSSWRFSYGRSVIVEVLAPVSPEGRTSHELMEVCREVLVRRVETLRQALRASAGVGWTPER